MRIFVTGGRGMVGRNIVEHAAASGHELLTPPRDELDLMNSEQVKDYLKKRRPDLVIHAAGTVGGIQANIARPVAFLVDNMTIGFNVILAAREAGIPRVLNIGSSCMYPRNADNPLKEEQILKGELEPTNEGYALSKVSCARLCDFISRESPELAYRTIVPSNLYGRHDKFDPLKSHMVPAVIAKVHSAVERGEDSVEIWGDGRARREFMYAGDLADFVYYTLDRFEKLPQYMNVGLGYDYNINEYYAAVAEIIGFKGGFVHDLSKPSGMAQKLVDTSRAEAFGWKASTVLKDGIRKTYEYYLQEVLK